MKNLVFKTNARHIGQLGRELVTDFVTALVELIKNSYDADADCVKLIFQNTHAVDGKIFLVDTGDGMTQEDFENRWMIIGTSNKMVSPYTKLGRKKVGKKGIGRFSVERLAEVVRIYSYPREGRAFKVEINWNRFEELDLMAIRQRIEYLRIEKDYTAAKFLANQLEYFFLLPKIDESLKKQVADIVGGDYKDYKIYYDSNLLDRFEHTILPLLQPYEGIQQMVDEISSPLCEIEDVEQGMPYQYLQKMYQRNGIRRKVSGLVLEMEGLRDIWEQKNIDKLQKELRLLVAPEFLEKNPFIIGLEAPEFQVSDEISVNDILNVSFAHVQAEVSEHGRNGHICYEDKENRKEQKTIIYEKPLQCGNFSFDMYFFLRDAEHLGIGAYNARFAQQLLNTYCGIKIYRDNFRVKPYGEIGNDWLFLDQAKVKDTHGYLVGNNQTIGRVNISDIENPGLVDATNREGIIENAAYVDLRDFVLECVNLISQIRREKLVAKEKEKQQLEKENRELQIKRNQLSAKAKDIERAEQEIKKTFAAQNDSNSKKITAFVKKNKDYRKLQTEYQKKYEDNSSKRYNTTAALLEFQESEAHMYKNLATLGMLASEFSHETSDVVNRLFTSMGIVERYLVRLGIEEKYLRIVRNTRIDFKRISSYSRMIIAFLRKSKREQAAPLNVLSILKEICGYYIDILNEFNIYFVYECPEDIVLVMKQIDLESIIVNMITNAYGQLKKSVKREFQIKISKKNDLVQLLFEDSGPGVSPENRERIFQPFVSTKADGVGLGLSIVKDIVERYEGNVVCMSSDNLGGAKFIVEIRAGGE